MLGSDTSAPPRVRPAPAPALPPERPRQAAPILRRSNRRVAVQRRSLIVFLADGLTALGRALVTPLRVLAKAILTLAVVAALILGGRLASQHVMASPRFAVREIIVSPTTRVTRDELLALAGVEEGQRLLAVDTDAVATRIASHPWVASARVRRQLPSILQLDIVERQAVAVAILGSLYLIDPAGRPFKRAAPEEAEGLAVVTGIDRGRYVAAPLIAAAAFREALKVLALYRSSSGRPEVSEINLDARLGFTLFLLDGAEVRLGRTEHGKKLAWFDRILEAVAEDGAGARAIRVIHLDGSSNGRVRVPVRLATAPAAPDQQIDTNKAKR